MINFGEDGIYTNVLYKLSKSFHQNTKFELNLNKGAIKKILDDFPRWRKAGIDPVIKHMPNMPGISWMSVELLRLCLKESISPQSCEWGVTLPVWGFYLVRIYRVQILTRTESDKFYKILGNKFWPSDYSDYLNNDRSESVLSIIHGLPPIAKVAMWWLSPCLVIRGLNFESRAGEGQPD